MTRTERLTAHSRGFGAKPAPSKVPKAPTVIAKPRGVKLRAASVLPVLGTAGTVGTGLTAWLSGGGPALTIGGVAIGWPVLVAAGVALAGTGLWLKFRRKAPGKNQPKGRPSAEVQAPLTSPSAANDIIPFARKRSAVSPTSDVASVAPEDEHGHACYVQLDPLELNVPISPDGIRLPPVVSAYGQAWAETDGSFDPEATVEITTHLTKFVGRSAREPSEKIVSSLYNNLRRSVAAVAQADLRRDYENQGFRGEAGALCSWTRDGTILEGVPPRNERRVRIQHL